MQPAWVHDEGVLINILSHCPTTVWLKLCNTCRDLRVHQTKAPELALTLTCSRFLTLIWEIPPSALNKLRLVCDCNGSCRSTATFTNMTDIPPIFQKLRRLKLCPRIDHVTFPMHWMENVKELDLSVQSAYDTLYLHPNLRHLTVRAEDSPTPLFVSHPMLTSVSVDGERHITLSLPHLRAAKLQGNLRRCFTCESLTWVTDLKVVVNVNHVPNLKPFPRLSSLTLGDKVNVTIPSLASLRNLAVGMMYNTPLPTSMPQLRTLTIGSGCHSNYTHPLHHIPSLTRITLPLEYLKHIHLIPNPCDMYNRVKLATIASGVSDVSTTSMRYLGEMLRQMLIFIGGVSTRISMATFFTPDVDEVVCSEIWLNLTTRFATLQKKSGAIHIPF